MSLTEKIREIFEKDAITEELQLAEIEKRVLAVVNEVGCELAELLKNRPKKNQFKPSKPSADSLVWGYGYIDKLEEYLKAVEKKVAELGEAKP